MVRMELLVCMTLHSLHQSVGPYPLTIVNDCYCKSELDAKCIYTLKNARLRSVELQNQRITYEVDLQVFVWGYVMATLDDTGW